MSEYVIGSAVDAAIDNLKRSIRMSLKKGGIDLDTLKLEYVGRKPYRAHETDAGLDLYSDKELTISPGQTELVNTGTRVAIPDTAWGMLVPRSSLHKKGLILANNVGVIDPDYRGEVMVALRNLTGKDVTVGEGERIAQLILTPQIKYELVEVDTLDTTVRGEGGFGSTGKI